MQNQVRNAARQITASPPRTPPTIAPIGTSFFCPSDLTSVVEVRPPLVELLIVPGLCGGPVVSVAFVTVIVGAPVSLMVPPDDPAISSYRNNKFGSVQAFKCLGEESNQKAWPTCCQIYCLARNGFNEVCR
jgi:hypothetical protein